MISFITFTVVFLCLRQNVHWFLILETTLILWVICATLNKICAKIKKLNNLPRKLAELWIYFLFGSEIMRYIVNNFHTLDGRIVQSVLAPLAYTAILASLSAFIVHHIHRQVAGEK